MNLVRSVPLVRKRTRRSKFSLLYNDAFLSHRYNMIYYYYTGCPKNGVGTDGALRCRTDYRKRQKNVKKVLLDLFPDLAVFESGT
jgi:hypothetical protein